MKRRIRAALFDVDGTLIDTWRLYLESFRVAMSQVAGRELNEDEVRDLHPRPELRFFLDDRWKDRFDALYGAFLGTYEAVHATHCDGWYPGAPEALRALLARGYLTGVVTAKSRRAYDISARALGFPEFRVAICDDDVNLSKPHPEGLLRACAELGVHPAEAIYIGDSSADAGAAEAAGCAFGAALWAKNDAEQREFRQVYACVSRYCELGEPGDLLAGIDEL